MVQTFPLFRLCKDTECDHQCSHFHPSLEEEGVESGLLDTWAFRWHLLDGSKANPNKADVLSVYLRIHESSFDTVHRASWHRGVFFEPRNADTPGPDERFAVVWLPQTSLGDAAHRVRTVDHCIAVCRISPKYGIRCLSKHQEELHQQLCPEQAFCLLCCESSVSPRAASSRHTACIFG